MTNEPEKHPSYGMISFSRISGCGRLFGSPISEHCGAIMLRISAGERTHEDGEDCYRARERYIEVCMSAAQFADAITMMNMGDGVPCTIRALGGKVVEGVPDTEASETHRAEESFKNRVAGFVRDLKTRNVKVNEILAKDRLSKADRDAVRGIIEQVITEIGTNAPFFVELFAESTEKVKAKAKSEIAAMMDYVLRVAGLRHLQEKRLTVGDVLPLLDDGER